MWLRLKFGSCEHITEPSGSKKCSFFFYLIAKQVPASQEKILFRGVGGLSILTAEPII
jgi:ABC-type iron transport system FetAB ATPase subunit